MRESNEIEAGDRLEAVSDSTWRGFCAAPVAVLLVAESGCPACADWTRALREYLQRSDAWNGVRFGKIDLDLPTAEGFRTANAEWLALVEGIPFNVLYVNGEPQTSFAGAGIDRLERRLSRYASGVAPSGRPEDPVRGPGASA